MSERTIGQFRLLPLEQLRPGKNLRRKRSPIAQRMLVESVAAFGVLHELLVRPVPPDLFEIVSGFGRYEAAQACGLLTLPCRVIEADLSPVDIERYQFTENRVREDVDPLVHAEVLKRIQDEQGLDQRELAALFAIPQPRVSELLGLVRLTEQQKVRFRRGELSLRDARKLVQKRTRRSRGGPGISSPPPESVRVDGTSYPPAAIVRQVHDQCLVLVINRNGSPITPAETKRALSKAQRALNSKSAAEPKADISTSHSLMTAESSTVDCSEVSRLDGGVMHVA